MKCRANGFVHLELLYAYIDRSIAFRGKLRTMEQFSLTIRL